MHDSGNRKEFTGGGVRDTAEGKERFELLWTSAQPYDDQMLTRAARWMARGAEKYADRNWEEFSGDEALEHAKASLLRHVHKLLAGQEDEDHAAAAWFNVQAIELVRWKQGQAREVVDASLKAAWDAVEELQRPRYFSVGGWIWRWDGKQMTYVSAAGRSRCKSLAYSGDRFQQFLADCGPNPDEIPLDEVPEWAR